MFQVSRLLFGRLHNSHLRLLVNAGYCSDSGQQPPKGEDAKDQKHREASEKKDPQTSTAALKRLNELLAMMNTDTDEKLLKKVEFAKPRDGQKHKEKVESSDSDSDSSDSSDDEKPKDLAQATRKVASSLGGDAKKTEAELLAKLMGDPGTGASLGEVITGMQIDKQDSRKASQDIKLKRSNVVRKSIEKKNYVSQEAQAFSRERKRPPAMKPTTGTSVKLFEEEPLGIFTDPSSLKESDDILKTWKSLQDRELRLAVTHPPANYFQKMALWTEQGKLWKFPIDNEQGRDAESKVSFTEHIFLDEHLEPWCPKRGPVRHFMELVCVGLSKNHYITAQEKKDHILWFRDYFEQKKSMLEHVIVDQQQQKAEIGATKQKGKQA
ncbi:28S ribosomal protein S31, mitochondrial [Uranotaenia lowii]|uniref:28S ribosomal protein S31, mitochondrial n=1 Tax=Uranotaenia lowii TaxID=190385 RepID=UPI0024799553|nr:28S ribosomal protein S31, mitochondrial [Uranotaenia lowii]